MATGIQLKEIAKARLITIQHMIDKDECDMAVHLSMLALECALKSVVCKTLNLTSDYPDNMVTGGEAIAFRTHNFYILIMLAGMKEAFSIETESIFAHWSELNELKIDTRYDPIGSRSKEDAKRKLEAVKAIIDYIEAKNKW